MAGWFLCVIHAVEKYKTDQEEKNYKGRKTQQWTN